MPRLITVALALSLLLNAFFVAGFVYRGWIAPVTFDQRMPPLPPGGRLSALETVAGDLNLAPGQRQELSGVFEQHAQVRRDRSRDMQRLREQIEWREVRARTEASPFARAFFTLVEGLGIVEPG